LADLTSGEIGQIGKVGQAIAAAQRTALGCQGITLFLADGEMAGQEVFHAHLHVLPRYTPEDFGLKFATSYGKAAERATLDVVAARIQANLRI
jgi:diadenosine tetraphosphate (Ap4A) HIT family hydrolase